MEWAFDYLEKEGIVAAKVIGLMDWDSHKKFAQEMFSFAVKHKSHKILIDFLEMTPKTTILEIDDMPKVLSDLGVGPGWKIAALHDPKSPKASEFDFFRNVAALLSIRVRHFADKNEAIAWLKSRD